jgi:hypothetical protein
VDSEQRDLWTHKANNCVYENCLNSTLAPGENETGKLTLPGL